MWKLDWQTFVLNEDAGVGCLMSMWSKFGFVCWEIQTDGRSDPGRDQIMSPSLDSDFRFDAASRFDLSLLPGRWEDVDASPTHCNTPTISESLFWPRNQP
jgi:hypothetical protein